MADRLDRIEEVLEKVGERLDTITANLDRVATTGYLNIDHITNIETAVESLTRLIGSFAATTTEAHIRNQGLLEELLLRDKARDERNEIADRLVKLEQAERDRIYRAEQRERDRIIDARIDKLVISLGQFISRNPAA